MEKMTSRLGLAFARLYESVVIKMATIVLIMETLFACGQEEDVDIIGTWIRETYETGDTIVFTSDNRIEKYFKYYETMDYQIGYKLKNDTMSVYLKHDDHFAEEYFKYSINGNKLTIYGFTYPFSIVSVVRENVVFRKVK